MSNTNHKKNLSAQVQKKHLQQLLLDMQVLFNLARSSLTEPSQSDEIAQIMIELRAFTKILEQRREYTVEQVNALASRINEFTNIFSKIKNKSDVLLFAKKKVDEIAQKELGSLYRGTSPLQLVNIEFTVQDDFAKRMTDISASCEKVEASLELVKANSPGHKYGKMEAMIHACKRAKDAVMGYFNLGIIFAKELQYNGNRALIATKFKVATPQESLDAAQRRKLALEEELRRTNATILGTQIQLERQSSLKIKGKSDVFKKNVKKNDSLIASKSLHLNEKQKEALQNVFRDLQKLTAWSEACFAQDSPHLKKFQQMNIELMAFNKILERDQEFTQEQVNAVVHVVKESTKMFTKLKSNEDIILDAQQKIGINANAVLASMNKGQGPLKDQKITVELAPDFTKKMMDIGNCCRSLEQNVKALQGVFPARQYGVYDQLAKAALSAKKGILSFFKAGLTLANEVQYYGRRALIVTQFVIPSPQDKLESISRKKTLLQEKERQAQAQKLGTVTQMKQKQLIEQKDQPKIFKYK